jgi:glycosyltransferase involved in cell wall biosynthesis
MRTPLYFDWGISMLYGWGVYGLNLLRHWPRVADAPAYCIGQIQLEGLAGIDPLTAKALMLPLVDSDQMRLSIEGGETSSPLDGVVLHALGNFMKGSTLPSAGGIAGRATAGVIFFEDTNLPGAAEIASDYTVILAGSSWCEEILRSRGVENVATVIQGVDPALFHPAPRGDLLPGRFAIFSGGKLEHRKAQDLVLLAFRAFAERHPEAVLVTAWHSPWPITALTVNTNPDIHPVELNADGRVDSAAWAAANGIPAERFIDLGTIPNHQMARVLREMDVALFPNRCEGGTNLVAMECMACGVPTILSDNTGHKDVLATNGAYRLTRQSTVIANKGTEGWGESDIEEIVEALEQVWRDRAEATRRAQIGAAAMLSWSWHNQVGKLHDTLQRFAP